VQVDNSMSTPTPEPTPVSGILDLPYTFALEIIIIFVIAVTVERFVTSYLSKFSKRAKLEPNTSNNLMLTFRILILIAAVAAISRVSGFPSEWILSVSAIGAAAVGFASQKTIGNFVAGIFLMAARPFKVGNYVRIGTVEGIVREITINYTKILTSANNTVSISNLQILDRDITNFLYECPGKKEIYCYTFEIAFDHTVDTGTIGRIFKETFESHINKLPMTPAYALSRSTGIERVYIIYLYVTAPEHIFALRPKIAEEVFQRWDQERSKAKK